MTCKANWELDPYHRSASLAASSRFHAYRSNILIKGAIAVRYEHQSVWALFCGQESAQMQLLLSLFQDCEYSSRDGRVADRSSIKYSDVNASKNAFAQPVVWQPMLLRDLHSNFHPHLSAADRLLYAHCEVDGVVRDNPHHSVDRLLQRLRGDNVFSQAISPNPGATADEMRREIFAVVQRLKLTTAKETPIFMPLLQTQCNAWDYTAAVSDFQVPTPGLDRLRIPNTTGIEFETNTVNITCINSSDLKSSHGRSISPSLGVLVTMPYFYELYLDNGTNTTGQGTAATLSVIITAEDDENSRERWGLSEPISIGPDYASLIDARNLTGDRLSLFGTALADGISRHDLNDQQNLGVLFSPRPDGQISYVNLLNQTCREIELVNSSTLLDPNVPVNFVIDGWGWGYGFNSPTAKFAIAVLLVHAFIVILYVAYCIKFCFSAAGWKSQAWGSIEELLALAINSRPADQLRNTGAGIDMSSTIMLPLRVRERHGKQQHVQAELVLAREFATFTMMKPF
ncbi:hypothetical protein FHL15_005170 [Xylaria flabelliformis]|uniref:Uncharacterized protein n=1 Tax=Xylaria flabelliformis TaxID=2512241 RepID=A0A553I1M0_9PEZI|nr:hypothetical protein FHL15_005170 [Xylaria flabelliformis]